jgi:hypothetical protein
MKVDVCNSSLIIANISYTRLRNAKVLPLHSLFNIRLHDNARASAKGAK